MLCTYRSGGTGAKRKLLPATIKHNKHLNAKVGSKNEGIEKIMGKDGMGMMNDDRKRLVELCLGNNLVIGGIYFEIKLAVR